MIQLSATNEHAAAENVGEGEVLEPGNSSNAHNNDESGSDSTENLPIAPIAHHSPNHSSEIFRAHFPLLGENLSVVLLVLYNTWVKQIQKKRLFKTQTENEKEK